MGCHAIPEKKIIIPMLRGSLPVKCLKSIAQQGLPAALGLAEGGQSS